MRRRTTSDEASSLLEVVLRVQGDLRRALAPIGVTPLQAGVLTYLRLTAVHGRSLRELMLRVQGDYGEPWRRLG